MSERNEVVVTYADLSESSDNEAIGGLYKSVMLVSRNFARQGKASEGNEAVDTYGDLTESQI